MSPVPRNKPSRVTEDRVPIGNLGERAVVLLREIGRLAAARNAEAYVVGGVVRDLMLGRESPDLDVVIVGDAAQVARDVRRRRGGALRSHGRFGTSTLVLPGGPRLDLAAARAESYARPAALPHVAPADLAADLGRRDFTINAMAACLDPRRFGRIRDPYDGRRDLQARQIRILHGSSFVDDPTRIVRALRFAARLDFAFEPTTARALAAALRRNRTALLSPARLLRELRLLLDERPLARVLRLGARTGLWRKLDPAIRVTSGAARRAENLESLLDARSAAGGAVPPRWAAGLALLTRSLPAGSRERLIDRLRPDRRTAVMLGQCAEEADRVLLRLARRRRLNPGRVRGACIDSSIEGILLAALFASRSVVRDALRRYFVEDSLVELEINGKDLLEQGLLPGPAVAVALEAALRARLDGEAPDARSQLRVALRRVRPA